MTIGVAANFAVEPLSAISIYAMIASLSMVFVLFWNVARLSPRSAEPQCVRSSKGGC